MNEAIPSQLDGRRPHSGFGETFWRYIKRRELRYPRCAVTGAVLGYTARQSVHAPGGAVDWFKASGLATLYSYMVFHRPYRQEFPVPYNIAYVELSEGPLLTSTVLIDDLAKLKVGMALRAKFEESGRLVFVPEG